MGAAVICFFNIVIVLSSFIQVTKSVSTSATSPSVFLAEPSNATLVFEHGDTSTTKSVELTCVVKSLQNNQKVSWIKHGKGVISDNGSVRSTVVDEFRYIIKTEQFTSAGTVWNSFNLFIYQTTSTHAQIDGGEYKCAVLEEGNDSTVIAESRTAVLEIYVIPRISHPLCFLNGTESSFLTDIALVEHQCATLSCRADPGFPFVDLIWHRNNITLSDTRYGLLAGENIFYNDFDWTVVRNDAGLTFVCQLQHPGLRLGNHSRNNASCNVGPFEVFIKPEVSIEPEYMKVDSENGNLVFVCNVNSGNPPVIRIHWLYDGKDVSSYMKDSLQSSENGNELVVKAIDVRNGGHHEITCIAENAVGIGTAKSILEVMMPASIPSTMTTDGFNTRSSSSSEVAKQGSPPLNPSRSGYSSAEMAATAVGSLLLGSIITLVLVGLLVVIKRNHCTGVEKISSRTNARAENYREEHVNSGRDSDLEMVQQSDHQNVATYESVNSDIAGDEHYQKLDVQSKSSDLYTSLKLN